MRPANDYAVLSGTLLAHLEVAATDLELALRSIPKANTPARAQIKARIASIRTVLAKYPMGGDGA